MSRTKEELKKFMGHRYDEGEYHLSKRDYDEIVEIATRTNEIREQAIKNGWINQNSDGAADPTTALARVNSWSAAAVNEQDVNDKEEALARAYESLVILAEVLGFELCHCERSLTRSESGTSGGSQQQERKG